MRIMAIAAGHASSVHLALLERSVVENLIQHLTIDMEQPAV